MSTSVRMAAFVLLLLGIAMGALAVAFLADGSAYSGLRGIFAGVVVAVVAAIHAIAAFGLWRARVWATWLALAIAVVGLAAAVLTGVGALNSGMSIAAPYYGQFQPWVDLRGLVLALVGGLGYAIVLWVVLERIASAREKPGASGGES
ncbi:MAG: hypothetical protein ABI725_05970 [Chloroflexota bacterium]